jgi:hypothetical protein
MSPVDRRRHQYHRSQNETNRDAGMLGLKLDARLST